MHVRTALVILLSLGALFSPSEAQRAPIPAKVGDSIFVGFSFPTGDSAKAFKGGATFTGCGLVHVFKRHYADSAHAKILGNSGDTVTYAVTGCAAPVVVPPVVVPVVDSTAPELPRVYLDTRMTSTVSTGRMLLVAGNLQAALDSAQQGDRVTLPCGATYRGNFAWTFKPGASWSAVQPASTMCLVPEGMRITPHVADSLHVPRILSLGQGSALETRGPAHHLRIISIEIAADSTVTGNTNGLLAFGNGDETTLAQIPSDIIVDRCYIHGRPDLDTRRGVTLNSARTAVVDSWVSEIHSTSDSNGIAGWNGPGPYKIVNNTIQVAGVSIGSGGAHVYLPGNVASDWEIRRNWMTKDLAWKGRWVMKNSFETKNARRMLIEGNVFENSPQDGQGGFAFVLWSADQDGAAPWSTTNNVTIRYNVIRNVGGGFNLSAHGYKLTETEPMHHILIANNVLIGIDGPASAGIGLSVARTFQIGDVIPHLTIEHNTGFSANATFIFGGAKPLPYLILRNNLLGGGQYQIINGLQGLPAWTDEAGVGSSFTGNVMALWGQFSGAQIAGSIYPNAIADLALIGGPSVAFSPTASLDAFALTPGSWLSGKGADGKDPGADIAAVKAAIAGVVVVP